MHALFLLSNNRIYHTLDGYSQATGAKDSRHANLTTNRHLQAPNKVDRYTQHRNIRNKVENRRRDIKLNDIRALSWLFRIPDFASWPALCRRNYQESCVETGVRKHQSNSEPVRYIALSRTENPLDQKHDR